MIYLTVNSLTKSHFSEPVLVLNPQPVGPRAWVRTLSTWLCARALSSTPLGSTRAGATHQSLQAQAEGLGGGRGGELPDARELLVQGLIFCNDLAQVLLPGERANGRDL